VMSRTPEIYRMYMYVRLAIRVRLLALRLDITLS